MQRHVLHAKPREEGVREADDLRIRRRRRRAEALHTELMMLAVAARLGLLIAEVRNDIIGLERPALRVE